MSGTAFSTPLYSFKVYLSNSEQQPPGNHFVHMLISIICIIYEEKIQIGKFIMNLNELSRMEYMAVGS